MKEAYGKAKNAYLRFESMAPGIPECAVLCLFVLFLAIMMYFHEPWYDEAQAWLIARDGTWKEILFEIPHYEGHPPFWFVFLALFAKAGADFTLTIRALTLCINACAVAVLLFRSPFPRVVRFLLPFTYFAFYQHGVICRPYSFLFLGLLLTASLWEKKNEKPFLAVLSLMLCCASSAYGILLAGGIAICWLTEEAKGKNVSGFLKGIFSGKRFFAFLLLLVFALANIALIVPHDDTFAASYGMTGHSVLFRLCYMFFGSVADATLFSCYEDYNELRYASFGIGKYIAGCVIGALLLVLILYIGYKNGTLMLFALPFSFFALFSGIVYFYLQHIDVLFQFLLFWAWVTYKKSLAKPKEAPKKKWQKAVRPVCAGVSALAVAVSLCWTFLACRNEVWFPYGYAEAITEYLDSKGLSDLGIMVRWKSDTDPDGSTYMNVNQTVNGVALNAYYDHNIVVNMNGGEEKETFASHRIPSDEETEKILAAWQKMGLPALSLDKCQIGVLFPEYGDAYRTFYDCILKAPEYHLWKGDLTYTEHKLYIRKDIVRKYRLEPEF